MPSGYESHSVAWVPDPASTLAAFGRAWTGWCPDAGEAHDGGAEAALMRQHAGTRGPAGLVAFLTPPMPIAPGHGAWGLERDLGSLADEITPFDLPRLVLATVAQRVALVPRVASAPATRLIHLLLRRVGRRRGLAGPLRREDASFHLPLTRRLPPSEADALAAALDDRLARCLAEPIRIGEIALMGDPGGGRPMRVVERYRLGGEPARDTAGALSCLGPMLLT